jgi:hypothetical protein
MGTIFLVGCCVLPFHQVVHKIMPVCEMAVNAIRGDQGSHESAPAREREEPVKRIVTTLPQGNRLAGVAGERRVIAPAATTGYRSFITLGAVRCDRDVGLHVLVETFLI